MKIYLAGPCDSNNREMMKTIGNLLSENFEVYKPWELKIENAWDMSQEEWARKVFIADIDAINNCDAMILISFGRDSTAGTNWEQGYAYALNKQIIVLQVTDAPTSLMTFYGCNYFINSDKQNLENDIKLVKEWIENPTCWNPHCDTILT